MIFSTQQMLSDGQSVTVTAASTHTLDTGAFRTPHRGNALNRDLGKGTPIPMLAQVVENFAGLTSLKISVQCDDDSNFGSAKTVIEETIAVADLKAGRQASFQVLPNHLTGRYIRLYYTTVGTATAGKITAGITLGNQTS